VTRVAKRPVVDDQELVVEVVLDRSAVAPGELGTPGEQAVQLDPNRLAAATERALHAVRGFVEPNGGGPGWAPVVEPTREVGGVLITHHLLGSPDELVEAFARFWHDRRGCCKTFWGTVRLAPAEVDRPVLAAWRGRLRMRTSPVPIRVELDVERWRSIGLIVTMRPVRSRAGGSGARRIGAHRRWAWFLAGHGVLEQVRQAVEAPTNAR
jgi:hypothetical protein